MATILCVCHCVMAAWRATAWGAEEPAPSPTSSRTARHWKRFGKFRRSVIRVLKMHKTFVCTERLI